MFLSQPILFWTNNLKILFALILLLIFVVVDYSSFHFYLYEFHLDSYYAKCVYWAFNTIARMDIVTDTQNSDVDASEIATRKKEVLMTNYYNKSHVKSFGNMTEEWKKKKNDEIITAQITGTYIHTPCLWYFCYQPIEPQPNYLKSLINFQNPYRNDIFNC